MQTSDVEDEKDKEIARLKEENFQLRMQVSQLERALAESEASRYSLEVG